jgi:hypothetical protein
LTPIKVSIFSLLAELSLAISASYTHTRKNDIVFVSLARVLKDSAVLLIYPFQQRGRII